MKTLEDGRVEIDGYQFEKFDLVRLLNTVFQLEEPTRFAVFTDLKDVSKFKGLAYLDEEGYVSQKHAYRTLVKGIENNLDALKATGVDFFGYTETGGSNLDLPDTVMTPEGAQVPLREALEGHGIVLYMGTWSATAPITKLAKEMGFRGATMHGTNDRILASGLAVDYNEVSARAERMRQAITGAESLTLHWHVAGKDVELKIGAKGREMQKSHGLVSDIGDVANLPAGEVYYIPQDANGLLPQKFEDEQETIAIFAVKDRAITGVHEFVRGDEKLVQEYLKVIEEDPNAGQITELGIGTQNLPWAYADIQDEKILGTAHVATGAQRPPRRRHRLEQLQGQEERVAQRHPLHAREDARDRAQEGDDVQGRQDDHDRRELRTVPLHPAAPVGTVPSCKDRNRVAVRQLRPRGCITGDAPGRRVVMRLAAPEQQHRGEQEGGGHDVARRVDAAEVLHGAPERLVVGDARREPVVDQQQQHADAHEHRAGEATAERAPVRRAAHEQQRRDRQHAGERHADQQRLSEQLELALQPREDRDPDEPAVKAEPDADAGAGRQAGNVLHAASLRHRAHESDTAGSSPSSA